jgi:hypothetical protein
LAGEVVECGGVGVADGRPGRGLAGCTEAGAARWAAILWTLDGQFLCGVSDMKGPPWRARDPSCIHCLERETGKDGCGRRPA